MNGWVDKSKIKSSDLSKLGLREKRGLHEESRYVLLTERTLLDLISGIKDLFKEGTATVLYYVFKEAGKRKTKSLIEDLHKYEVEEIGRKYPKREADSMVLREALDELEAEGYGQKFELEADHKKRRAVLRIRQPLSVRLEELARDAGIDLTDKEISAIGRGLVAGIFSALTETSIDVKETIIDRKREEVVYILPKEVYEKIFAV